MPKPPRFCMQSLIEANAKPSRLNLVWIDSAACSSRRPSQHAVLLQKIHSKEGFPLHELRPHMLLLAATLPVNAESVLRSPWSKGSLCSAWLYLEKLERVEISCMRCQFQIQLTA